MYALPNSVAVVGPLNSLDFDYGESFAEIPFAIQAHDKHMQLARVKERVSIASDNGSVIKWRGRA